MVSLSLSKKASLIFPAKWTSGGRGLDKFRESIINSKDISSLYIYEDARIFFPTAKIAGGICITTYQENWNDKCHYVWTTIDNKTQTSEKFLKDENAEILLRNVNSSAIIKKISDKTNKKFSEIVSVQKPYGFRTDIFNNPKTKRKYKIHPNHQENDYKIYGVGGHKGAEGRKVEFVNKKYISIDVLRNKDKYKLFFSKAFTYKYPYNSFPKIIIAGPQEICSETFLAIGCFDTKTQAENCLSFIKTRLWRYLFSVYWSGMIVSQKNFSLIPLIDFLDKWDDRKTYDFFNLSQEEIKEIEQNVGKFDEENYARK